LRFSLVAGHWFAFARLLSTEGPEGDWLMALYLLATLVVLLIVYLFYAVIHPERF
jgi:K+-transporting ATPase KdpF subunit